VSDHKDSNAIEEQRLGALGYKQELSRVLSPFHSFSVAFTYLSPMVGIYSLFVLGAGAGGPRYIWLMFIPVIGMYSIFEKHYRSKVWLVGRLVLHDGSSRYHRSR